MIFDPWDFIGVYPLCGSVGMGGFNFAVKIFLSLGCIKPSDDDLQNGGCVMDKGN